MATTIPDENTQAIAALTTSVALLQESLSAEVTARQTGDVSLKHAKADAEETSAALLALASDKADKAVTLEGYGITDAKIANGTITLGADSITPLTSHQSLDAYVNAASYDSTSKKILLKHDSNTIAEIDATAFIKDGMVSGVAISNGKLVITFNTDAGQEPIEIPLTDIFNPANYYDKAAADAAFVAKVEGKGLSTEDFTTEDKQKLAGIAEGADVTPPPIAPSQNPDDTGKAADAYETGWRLAAKAEARSGTQGNIAVYAEYSTLLEDSGFKPSDFATHDDVALVASNVDTAQATADYAQSSANDAFTKAGEALSTANNARSAADEAKSTADTAKATADNAYSVAKRVETDVSSLSMDVHEARTVADEAKSSAEGASSMASAAVDESRKAWSAASEAKELAQAANTNAEAAKYYTTTAQSVTNGTEVVLSERTFNVFDATAYGDTNTVKVTLPAEPTAESGKVADVLLRVETGATVPTLDFDETANTFIAADNSWATLEASSHNVFSFTSAGVTRTGGGAKRVWVVGRVTAALETGGV